jgi:hypothetical protein
MTGVSWGQYQDYLYGKFDGKNHVDEAQTDRHGNVISHGGDVYYMCPGPEFGKYLSQGVLRAIDAGAEGIHLEEPEFWARAGYSEGFKRAWRDHYKEEWTPPHESADAQYKTSRLKYVLYREALKQVFDAVKEHNRKTGKDVKCYVPTHSLVNYALWNIVSPESSLLTVGADGFIAQVWTGTARSKNFYEGKEAERTFQTAFFEYGSMTAVTRGGQGRLPTTTGATTRPTGDAPSSPRCSGPRPRGSRSSPGRSASSTAATPPPARSPSLPSSAAAVTTRTPTASPSRPTTPPNSSAS